MPTVTADALVAFTRSLFESAQVPSDEASRVAQSLVGANLRGHDSHGVIRVPQYIKALGDGTLKAGAPFQVEKDTGCLMVANGNWGLGQVQAHRLLERLIPKARAGGLAAGTLRQCGHIGRLGEYAEVATAARLAFMATVNGHGYGRGVAPPGGTAARIGTNPLCLGVPSTGEPVILDIGTSVVAEGKVRVCHNKGVPAPPGWLLDHRGQPTTDPNVLYRDPRGSILPLGGTQAYKGFGLGLLMDMLAGGLSGAPCSQPSIPLRVANAVFFLVLDIDHFAGAEHFLREVSGLVDVLKNSPRAEGVEEILLPGDPERRETQKRGAAGIPLDDGTWEQLKSVAKQGNVPLPGHS